jgi:hypothetical protein
MTTFALNTSELFARSADLEASAATQTDYVAAETIESGISVSLDKRLVGCGVSCLAPLTILRQMAGLADARAHVVAWRKR